MYKRQNIDNTGGQQFKEEGLIEVLEGYKEQFSKEFTMSTHAAFKKDVAVSQKSALRDVNRDFTMWRKMLILSLIHIYTAAIVEHEPSL